MKFYLINFTTMVSEVFLINYSQIFCTIECSALKGEFKSAHKRISCGVPQGSVISPLLFLIYINGITKTSSFHTTSFADDINLHMSNSCSNVLQTTVKLELCKIDHWLRANKLSLNYNKTNFMLLTSRKHNPDSFIVTINNHTISPEDNLKYLGVLLDNKLSWKPHVQKVKTQLSRAFGIPWLWSISDIALHFASSLAGYLLEDCNWHYTTVEVVTETECVLNARMPITFIWGLHQFWCWQYNCYCNNSC